MKLFSVMRRILIPTSNSSQFACGSCPVSQKKVRTKVRSEINSILVMESLSHRKNRRKLTHVKFYDFNIGLKVSIMIYI